jgi:hypothetical protein
VVLFANIIDTKKKSIKKWQCTKSLKRRNFLSLSLFKLVCFQKYSDIFALRFHLVDVVCCIGTISWSLWLHGCYCVDFDPHPSSISTSSFVMRTVAALARRLRRSSGVRLSKLRAAPPKR